MDLTAFLSSVSLSKSLKLSVILGIPDTGACRWRVPWTNVPHLCYWSHVGTSVPRLCCRPPIGQLSNYEFYLSFLGTGMWDLKDITNRLPDDDY